MIKSAKQQGANMTRTGPTHNWECRVWNKQKRDLNLLSQDHPAPVVCKNNIIPPLHQIKTSRICSLSSLFQTLQSRSVCVSCKKPIIIIKMFPPKQALTRSWVVLGFRRCWRVKQLFKDLLCVSDVALHAISDLFFNQTKIKDIMKTFGFLGGGNWQPITKLTKSFKITGAGGRLRT